MLGTLTTKRWLTWLLVATIWGVSCIFLGRWQWHRWQEKSVKQSQISDNYDGPTTSLADVMTTSKSPEPMSEWKQVKATGHYVGQTYMVRNRPGPQQGPREIFGYETLNVFETDGVKVLVDRGWVGNGTSAKTPQSVPKPPSGTITLVGWTRPSEPNLGRADVAGQVSSISVAEMQRRTGDKLVQGYLRMRTEKTASGSAPPRPLALDKPDQGQAAGINLSYAFQWWAGGIAGYAFVFLRARREHLDELWEAENPEAVENEEAIFDAGESQGATAPPVSETTAAAQPRPSRQRKPRKPKKTRIWDEEDE